MQANIKMYLNKCTTYGAIVFTILLLNHNSMLFVETQIIKYIMNKSKHLTKHLHYRSKVWIFVKKLMLLVSNDALI